MNEIAKEALQTEDSGLREQLFYSDGPLWYRGYADFEENQICETLRLALEKMEVIYICKKVF